MHILFPANRLSVQVEDAMAALILDAIPQVSNALMSFFVGCARYCIEAERLEQGSYWPDLIDVEALGLMYPWRAHGGCAVAILLLLLDVVINDHRVELHRIGKECRSRWSPY